MINRAFRLTVALLLLAGASGCPTAAGQKMSGQVTYNGKPVPYGQIFFDPDAAKGTAGSQGVGEIRDGRYETQPGFGTVTGPHHVRIIGYDGAPPQGPEAEMYPHGRPLPFGEYRTEVQIESGKPEMDFSIPLR